MYVQKQIAKMSRGDAIIYLQDASPTLGVHLHQDMANTRLISGIFKGNNVMSVSVDGLGKLARGKQILGQKQNGNVAMMRVFGKKIQHSLVLSPFFHQMVQHQYTALGKPFGQLRRVGNALVKLNAVAFFHAVKAGLPAIVGIHYVFGRYLKNGLFSQQIFHQHGLAASARGCHDDTGGVSDHDENRLDTSPGPCLL